MRRMISVVAVAGLAVAGCAGPARGPVDPQASFASADFTLPLVNGDLAAASEEAAMRCRAQGRTARLLARHRMSADFRCVE